MALSRDQHLPTTTLHSLRAAPEKGRPGSDVLTDGSVVRSLLRNIVFVAVLRDQAGSIKTIWPREGYMLGSSHLVSRAPP